MINYTKQAIRDLKKIPEKTRNKIRTKINQLHNTPDELANNIKKLSNDTIYRLRVGDYRIFYDQDGNILNILKVKTRGSAY